MIFEGLQREAENDERGLRTVLAEKDRCACGRAKKGGKCFSFEQAAPSYSPTERKPLARLRNRISLPLFWEQRAWFVRLSTFIIKLNFIHKILLNFIL